MNHLDNRHWFIQSVLTSRPWLVIASALTSRSNHPGFLSESPCSMKTESSGRLSHGPTGPQTTRLRSPSWTSFRFLLAESVRRAVGGDPAVDSHVIGTFL